MLASMLKIYIYIVHHAVKRSNADAVSSLHNSSSGSTLHTTLFSMLCSTSDIRVIHHTYPSIRVVEAVLRI